MRKPTIWVPTRSDTNRAVYSHRRWLVAVNFGFRKKRNCTICVAKTKLICAFVFAYADCCVSPCSGSNMSLNLVVSLRHHKVIASVLSLLWQVCMHISPFSCANDKLIHRKQFKIASIIRIMRFGYFYDLKFVGNISSDWLSVAVVCSN